MKGTPTMVTGRFAFTFMLCALSFWFLVQTLSLTGSARLAPLYVIVPTCVMLLIRLVLDLRTQSSAAAHIGEPSSEKRAEDWSGVDQDNADRGSILLTLGWLGGLVLLVLFLGVLTGIPAFLFTHALCQWKLPLWRALLIGATAFALLYAGLSLGLELDLDPGWLWQRFAEMA